MRGDLAASDHADKVLKIRDLLIGEFIQKAGNMVLQRAAVFEGLVAQDVEHLRIDHRRDEIERGVHVGNDAEQRRFTVANLVKLQIVAHHHVADFLDVERGQPSAAGNQNTFCGLA